MTAGLHIAPDLTLPIDLVTEPIGILANRGRGKSYTTHVLVEEIHDAHVPVVVLDVKGDWWGLRSSANGKADGLPFYIFGGDHADLPLEPTAGDLLADLVVDERVSVVLDLSHMSKTKARAFTVAFAERLYHRNRDPLFVVVDEADVLIPQRATAETARLLGAMEDIAKRGRGRGIGMAVVTQRPQEVAKSVLDLMDTLILLGMTGPRSLKSVSEWISAHVDEDTTAATVMAQLPSLPVGQAWVWSPMHELLERVAVRQIRTFDSHVTPKPGQTRTAPRGRIDLDLDALGERITATVERAKADDPRALRARIRELEHDLDVERAKPVPEPVEIRVEVPVLAPEIIDQLEALLEPAAALLGETQETLLKHRMWAEEQLNTGPQNARKQDQPTTQSRSRTGAGAAPGAAVPRAEGVATAASAPPSRRQTRPGTDPGEALTGPERRVLDAIAWLNAVGFPTPTKIQTGFIAGYRVGKKVGGTYGNVLGQLRSSGLIEYPSQGAVVLTAEGEAAANPADIEPTTEGLQAAIFARLAEPERRVLAGIVDAYPESLTKQHAGEQAGYTVGAKVGGTYGNILGRLRSLGLVEYPAPGLVVATDVLFLDAR